MSYQRPAKGNAYVLSATSFEVCDYSNIYCLYVICALPITFSCHNISSTSVSGLSRSPKGIAHVFSLVHVIFITKGRGQHSFHHFVDEESQSKNVRSRAETIRT
jgi:hypothetical protein